MRRAPRFGLARLIFGAAAIGVLGTLLYLTATVPPEPSLDVLTLDRAQLVVGDALDQAARRLHLAVQLGEQHFGDLHAPESNRGQRRADALFDAGVFAARFVAGAFFLPYSRQLS